MSASENIVLGTVQFGLPYGVANKDGMPDIEQVEQTLQRARRHGIHILDTATAYGESEVRLGSLGVTDMKVMTKLPSLPADCTDVRGWVHGQVAGSLARLRVDRLYGLSFHRPAQLMGAAGRELYEAVRELQEQGTVERIGISIYQPDELELLVAKYRFDMVQAPFNIFDRRLQASGWLDRLNALGCEVHARSIFLQGLLLMPPDTRPGYFSRWQSLFSDWDRWLADVALNPLQACVRFSLSVPGIARVVLGVDSPAQLDEVLAAADGPFPAVPAALCSTDPDLLNPARWVPA